MQFSINPDKNVITQKKEEKKENWKTKEKKMENLFNSFGPENVQIYMFKHMK